MTFSSMINRTTAVGCILAASFLLGYPAAYIETHGFSASGWPSNIGTPGIWFNALPKGDFGSLVRIYIAMARGEDEMLALGGRLDLSAIVTLNIFLGFMIFSGAKSPIRRHFSGVYGNARFATPAEIARCDTGLEVGVYGKRNTPVRLSVESNLLTIAPPRSGKTDGSIMPNLAVPDAQAWMGPAVVIDPKGEVFRATVRRRKMLGRTVRCLDPFKIGGGSDAWNPFDGIAPTDVARLQGIVKCMMPSSENKENDYFRDRATDLGVAALMASASDASLSVRSAARLVRDLERFAAVLAHMLENTPDEGTHDTLESALQICRFDAKTRDPIMSTAVDAFAWARDPSVMKITDRSTFSMKDICGGAMDLYIVPPADERATILAPYMRMVLGALMRAVRENRPKERIVAFIDEAFLLGHFSELLRGSGELPGYGLSFWLFFHSRKQMEEAFGATGAKALLMNSAVTSIFALPATDPDEAKYWSSAIGDMTFRHSNESKDPRTGQPSNTESAAGAPLVPPGDIPNLLNRGQLVFVNDRKYPIYPMQIRLSSAVRDPRFKGLIDPVKPVI